MSKTKVEIIITDENNEVESYSPEGTIFAGVDSAVLDDGIEYAIRTMVVGHMSPSGVERMIHCILERVSVILGLDFVLETLTAFAAKVVLKRMEDDENAERIPEECQCKNCQIKDIRDLQ